MQESTLKVSKPASHAVRSKMKLTLHATRRTSHGAARLVQAVSAWSVKIQRAPSRRCRDARVHAHTTTAMHANEYTLTPISAVDCCVDPDCFRWPHPAPLLSVEFCVDRDLLAVTPPPHACQLILRCHSYARKYAQGVEARLTCSS